MIFDKINVSAMELAWNLKRIFISTWERHSNSPKRCSF